MVSLRVEDVHIRLGEFDLREISWEVEAGEYFCILGPTGAGKSVLIECIAGLQKPHQGRIILDGRDVTALKPEERGIGYVPQDYALFPHMTVHQNIAFGLRVRRLAPDEIKRRVASLVDLLGIGHLLSRHPLTLSGGEKQRVALARALAVQPTILLLDEPLAAVDEMTRDRLCAELLDIQRKTGVTILHISHNFDEALAVSDRIAIMRAGRLVQVGTPEEIFSAPVDRFVAEFTRAENVLPVAEPPEPVGDSLVRVGLTGGEQVLAAAGTRPSPSLAVVRPETVRIVPLGPGASDRGDLRPGETRLLATIARITERGHLVRYEARTDGGLTIAGLKLRSEARASGLAIGHRVQVITDAADVHLL